MVARKALTIAVVLSLVGCAATPYQPNGMRGGYSEVRLGPDSYAVTFSGNGYSTEPQARSMAMLRGAEMCQDARYGWFAAVKDESRIDREVEVQPAETRINTYANTSRNGRYTGTTGYVTTTPERTTVTERPVAQLEIRCLRANPKRDRRIQNVQQYIRTVGPQFGVALNE